MRTNECSIRKDESTRPWKKGRLGLVGALVLLGLLFTGPQTFGQSATDSALTIKQLEEQANTDLRDQKTNAAAEGYQKILVLAPNNVQAHANLGLAYYLQSEFAQASEQFEAAIRLKPDLWDTAALCGLSDVKIGQRATAKPHLQQAFDHVHEPKLRMAVGRQLFSILFEEGDLLGASKIVNELEELDPTNIDVLYAAHQVYSLLANRAFLSIAQLAPDSARIYQLRGDNLIQSGNLRGAIAAYRKAIQRDPHLAGVHFSLGQALSASQSSEDRAQAEAQYKDALAENAQDEKAECGLGAIDLDRSDMESAMQHYKHALQLQPDDPEANEGLGMVLMSAKSYRDALVYLKRAVQLDPTDGPPHYRLALADRDLGDLDGANREMDEFRRLTTEKDNLRHSLNGSSLQETDRDTEGQEVPTPSKAAPLGPTSPH